MSQTDVQQPESTLRLEWDAEGCASHGEFSLSVDSTGWWEVQRTGDSLIDHGREPNGTRESGKAASEKALREHLVAELAPWVDVAKLQADRDEARKQTAAVELLLNLKYQANSCKVLLKDMTPEDREWRQQAKDFYARATSYLQQHIDSEHAWFRQRIAALESALQKIANEYDSERHGDMCPAGLEDAAPESCDCGTTDLFRIAEDALEKGAESLEQELTDAYNKGVVVERDRILAAVRSLLTEAENDRPPRDFNGIYESQKQARTEALESALAAVSGDSTTSPR